MAGESSDTARLLAELTQNAAEFNQATDSINSVIERFETTLRNLQVGIETWLSNPLYSDQGTRDPVNHGEIKMDEVSVRTQLGFAKHAGEWGLAVRTAVYGRNADRYGLMGKWELVRLEDQFRLRDASRQLRVEALRLFPTLLSELNRKVEDMTKAIKAARRFVDLC
jgi:hypothetical protein